MTPCSKCRVIARREGETLRQAQDYCSNCEARMSYTPRARARTAVDQRTHQALPIGTPRGMHLALRNELRGLGVMDLTVEFGSGRSDALDVIYIRIDIDGPIHSDLEQVVRRWMRRNAPAGVDFRVTVRSDLDMPAARAFLAR